ncbi:MAG: redox-sensitive transcriptional activator SoxR [Nitratireductor sp.]|nr:redox-sensitive transcriptional activator SoxR [Nitratireductor sp.]
MLDLSIGEIAARTGLAVSAVRYYENQGLIQALRSAGRQRRFARSEIRKLSFIIAVQGLGFTLDEIREMLAGLPDQRPPTKRDWARIGKAIGERLDERIAVMRRLRERLDGCIGCGCLSLDKCKLYNPGDAAAKAGTGPVLIYREGL